MPFYLVSVVRPVVKGKSFLLGGSNDVGYTEMIANCDIDKLGVTVRGETEGCSSSNQKVKMVGDVSFKENIRLFFHLLRFKQRTYPRDETGVLLMLEKLYFGVAALINVERNFYPEFFRQVVNKL